MSQGSSEAPHQGGHHAADRLRQFEQSRYGDESPSLLSGDEPTDDEPIDDELTEEPLEQSKDSPSRPDEEDEQPEE